MAKQIELDCPAELSGLIASAIRHFAASAYPPGGSECAQVSRAALESVAEAIEAALATGAPPAYARRQRALVCQAVEYYLGDETGADPSARALAPLALQAARGEPVSAAELAAARAD